MVNKRGYSFGVDHPIHYEKRGDSYAVFDARDDRDIEVGIKNDWDASKRCQDENEKLGFGCRPTPADIAAIDLTP